MLFVIYDRNKIKFLVSCIFYLSGMSYQEGLKELELSSLEYRRLSVDVIEVLKIINKINLVNIDKLFTLAQRARTRGHSWTLFMQTYFQIVW